MAEARIRRKYFSRIKSYFKDGRVSELKLTCYDKEGVKYRAANQTRL